MPEFPIGMPGSYERVPANPADMIRDVFFANHGRIRADLVDNMIGRHTFTYGQAILDAWAELQTWTDLISRDGDDWVWRLQTTGGLHQDCDHCMADTLRHYGERQDA